MRYGRIFSLLMSVALCFSFLPGPVQAVQRANQSDANESETDTVTPIAITSDYNCHEMTSLWFGETDTAKLMDTSGINRPEDLVIAYFSIRSADYPSEQVQLLSAEDVPMSEEVQHENDERQEQIEAMQNRLNIRITDSEVTVRIDDENIIYEDDGTIILYAYEWTFYDYDDLENGIGGSDVSGYGTYHKITLSEANGKYQILMDEYDESDFLGICTIKVATLAEINEYDDAHINFTDSIYGANNEMASLQSVTYYSDYDVSAVVRYADKYVKKGACGGIDADKYNNSEYANFNGPNAGDCANYTSQCIKAGGMPQDVGTPYGLNYWYYNSATDRSATWTGAGYLRDWMAANRGKLIIDASDSTIYTGSPVFYGNSHAVICVGKNDAGRPIINSHNKDYYHTLWTYYYGSPRGSTVQLTPSNSADNQPHIHQTIRKGSTGTCVIELQTALNRYKSEGWLKWDGDMLAVDGDFGDATERALKAFQDNQRITSDGVCGDFTWGYIENPVKPQPTVEEGSEMISGYERKLPDGDYVIASALDSSYFLDIPGEECPAARQSNVQLWQMDGEISAYDVWTVKYTDGFYRIKQKNSEIYLDVCDASKVNNVNVQVYDGNTSSAQKWAITGAGPEDGYSVAAKCSGYYLTVENQVAQRGGNINQRRGDGTSSQTWLFIPYQPQQPVENGKYVLVSAMSNDIELDVSGDTGDIPGGTNVQIWQDTAPSKYNSFNLVKLSNGYYNLIHSESGKALEVKDGTLKFDGNIQVSARNGMANQEWAITPNGNGYVLRVKSSGLTLDVTDGTQNRDAGNINGVNVRQFPFNGSTAQTWKFVQAEYTVSYDANSGTGAPNQQTKYYKSALQLSEIRPSRLGYDFLGWATSNGGSVQYQPGDTYTNDSNVTLYAVWSGPHGSEMASGYARVLPDGDYMIASALDPSYYLDIGGEAVPAANQDNVSLWHLDGEIPAYDVWTVTYADGFYKINQRGTSMSLDVYGISLNDNSNVSVWGDNESSAQKWAICKADSGDGYSVAAKCSGYLLTVEGKTATQSANVCQHIKDGSSSQSWLFIPYKPTQEIMNGNYVLISGMSDDIELDVSGDSGDIPDETNVQIWSDIAPSQYNSFTVQALANGYYKLINTASNKALEVKGGSLKFGENIQVSDENGTEYQQWAITRNGNGFILRSRHSGYTLDVENGEQNRDDGNINGVNVRQWDYAGTTSQTWKFIPAEYSVSFDASQGSGAPGIQTKYYNQVLMLSNIRPSRSNYSFIGWATSPDGEVRYQPGDIYYDNCDLNLYAVWRANNAIIDTVSRNGTTVTVNLTCTDSNASVFCAFYNNSGKMISMSSSQVTSESTYQFQFDGQQFDYAKAFILDENLRPLCQGKRT